MKEIKYLNVDSEDYIKTIESESIDIICTDPPYLYLKGQKLERPFDELSMFSEWKRVLKKGGFVILFGRGESFYRWNTILADLGFTFKEEIIWDKGQCSSPLMSLSRVHETVAIWTKGKGVLNKVKVPYLEMKQHDINSIVQDIKRMKAILNNTKSLNAVLAFLENNNLGFEKKAIQKANINSERKDRDRAINVVQALGFGMNEKTIIRTDREFNDKFTKFGVTSDKRKSGDRAASVAQAVEFGMNEKSIIKEVRNHYKAIHPTEKPIRLLKRLLKLVIKSNDTVLDPFAGGFTTGLACLELELNSIGLEIDKDFFDAGQKRLAQLPLKLF